MLAASVQDVAVLAATEEAPANALAAIQNDGKPCTVEQLIAIWLSDPLCEGEQWLLDKAATATFKVRSAAFVQAYRSYVMSLDAQAPPMWKRYVHMLLLAGYPHLPLPALQQFEHRILACSINDLADADKIIADAEKFATKYLSPGSLVQGIMLSIHQALYLGVKGVWDPRFVSGLNSALILAGACQTRGEPDKLFPSLFAKGKAEFAPQAVQQLMTGLLKTLRPDFPQIDWAAQTPGTLCQIFGDVQQTNSPGTDFFHAHGDWSNGQYILNWQKDESALGQGGESSLISPGMEPTQVARNLDNHSKRHAAKHASNIFEVRFFGLDPHSEEPIITNSTRIELSWQGDGLSCPVVFDVLNPDGGLGRAISYEPI